MTAGVVILGGGLAGQRCAETLRRVGYEGSIRIACAELHRPYDRPPLSKEALLDAAAEDTSFRSQEWYAQNDVELLLGLAATGLDLNARRVRLEDGSELPYAQLLIATGGRARSLRIFDGLDNVSTLRTLDDARALRQSLAPGRRLLLVGAGFIGQEVAAAACRAGAQATIVEAAPAPLAGLLGLELGRWFAELHRERGVELLLEEQVASVQAEQGAVRAVTLRGGRTLECDHVLLGVGIEPSLDWLPGSGLDPRGIATDVDGRSDAPGVYAAGDAAALFDPLLGRHVLGSHWEAAARQGARAAKAMLGLDPGAVPVSSFWSDLYGTRVQYLGHAPLADEVRFDGDLGARRFTATFTHDGRPVAVLLAGRPQALPEARALLARTHERSHA